jgi:hypothetical protein
MKSTAVGRQAKHNSWEGHIREWKLCGLSQAEYCRKQCISIKCFGYWKRKLTKSERSISLVEVTGLKASRIFSRPNPLFLTLGGRYRIEIERGFDLETLDQLLRVLENRR